MKQSDIALILIAALGGAFAYHLFFRKKDEEINKPIILTNKPIVLQNDYLEKSDVQTQANLQKSFVQTQANYAQLKSEAAALTDQAEKLLVAAGDASLSTDTVNQLKAKAGQLQQQAMEKIQKTLVIH